MNFIEYTLVDVFNLLYEVMTHNCLGAVAMLAVNILFCNLI
jgi:hypothetical protein